MALDFIRVNRFTSNICWSKSGDETMSDPLPKFRIVKPTLFDTGNCRIKWRCPTCNKQHYWSFGRYDFSDHNSLVVLCDRVFRDHGTKFYPAHFRESVAHIPPELHRHLYELVVVELVGAKRDFGSPRGKIYQMPSDYCEECKGTGEYVGALEVSPCKTCEINDVIRT